MAKGIELPSASAMVSTERADRRRHLRAYIPISVSLRADDNPACSDGLLCNLSRSGALVACDRQVTPKQCIHLTLHMPGGGDVHVISTVARVGRFSDNRQFIGLRFSTVQHHSSSVIEEFMRSEAANRHCRAVLVADESPARLRQLSEQLTTRGYRPLLASTFLQATSLLAAEPDAIVLALVGNHLLSGSGQALLDWLHETRPSLHRAILNEHFTGTQLQRTLDRVSRECSPRVPWEIG